LRRFDDAAVTDVELSVSRGQWPDGAPMRQDGAEDLSFYAGRPALSRFADVLRAESFHPLPGNWLIGVADVVNSTTAIAEGRYKAVNMVGASVISAVLNVLEHRPFPFVFGGDGAAFAVPDGYAAGVTEALAATHTWAGEEMGLDLRAALVPVTDVRRAGHEVAVARFAPSEAVSYAMFSGGGVTWAESEMKGGRYGIGPAPAGTRPDLTGLSCRWSPTPAERGLILSVLVKPAGPAGEEFLGLAARLLHRLHGLGDEVRPFPAAGPAFSWRAPGLALEAHVPVGADRRPVARWKLRLFTLFAWLLFATGRKVGAFDPRRYRAMVVLNSDFRKFDDGLKLTVDCTAEEAGGIERLLEEGRRQGLCHYGLHRQDSALITCVVPSHVRDDHFHFIDGAEGGYARAAVMLKRSLAGG
jgi:hypothetical protein